MFKDLPLSHSRRLSMTVKVQYSLAVALSSPQCPTPFPRLPTGFTSLEASIVCLYQSSHSSPSSQYVFAFMVVTALNAFLITFYLQNIAQAADSSSYRSSLNSLAKSLP